MKIKKRFRQSHDKLSFVLSFDIEVDEFELAEVIPHMAPIVLQDMQPYTAISILKDICAIQEKTKAEVN